MLFICIGSTSGQLKRLTSGRLFVMQTVYDIVAICEPFTCYVFMNLTGAIHWTFTSLELLFPGCFNDAILCQKESLMKWLRFQLLKERLRTRKPFLFFGKMSYVKKTSIFEPLVHFLICCRVNAISLLENNNLSHLHMPVKTAVL